MTRLVPAALFAVIVALPSWTDAEIRTWSARTGNFSAEAELIDVKGGAVVLQKRDGSRIQVPLDRLSLADVRYVEKYLREATEAVGKPPEEGRHCCWR